MSFDSRPKSSKPRAAETCFARAGFHKERVLTSDIYLNNI